MVRLGNVLVIFIVASFSLSNGQMGAPNKVTGGKVTVKVIPTTSRPPSVRPSTAGALRATTTAVKVLVVVAKDRIISNTGIVVAKVNYGAATTSGPEVKISTNMTENLVDLKNIVCKARSSLVKLSEKSRTVPYHPGDTVKIRTSVILVSSKNISIWVYRKPKLNYEDAFNRCKDYGLQLVSIESKEKDLAVFEGLLFDFDKYWTSGNNLKDLSSFVWRSTGRPFKYVNFGVAEPSGEEKERCLAVTNAIRVKNTEWLDADCNEQFAFVCEKP